MKMVMSRGAIAVAFLLLCSLGAETTADTVDCTPEVVQLYPCLAFVTNQIPSPPRNCCDALDSVVQKTPVCLCELISRGKNGTANTGLPTLNMTLVRQLPKDCGVYTEVLADESQCPGAVHAAPAPSPIPSGPSGSAAFLTFVPLSTFVVLVWALIGSLPAFPVLFSLFPQ